jgi:drug/metabolite transporter (DMT)-like permease
MSVLLLILTIIVAKFKGEELYPSLINKKKVKYLLLRGIFGMGTQICFITSAILLPSDLCSIIMNTNSVVWIFYGYLFFNEKIEAKKVLYAVLSFVGVLISIRPDLFGLGENLPKI